MSLVFSSGQVVLESRTITADLIVSTSGTKLPGLYAKHPNLFDVEGDKVMVDRYLQPFGHENIFVLGDNSQTKYSGSAWTALHQAMVTAKNIVNLQKDRPMDRYEPHAPTIVIPVGEGWAVLADGRREIAGKRAWMAKRKADRLIFAAFMPYKKAVKKWRKNRNSVEF